MEFEPALPAGRNEARIFKDVKVLRDCLTRRAHLMVHGETRTDFKQGLAVSGAELIEDCPPGRVRQGFEDVTQTPQIIGKRLLACQPPMNVVFSCTAYHSTR